MQIAEGFETKLCILSLEVFERLTHELSLTGGDDVSVVYISEEALSTSSLQQIQKSIEKSVKNPPSIKSRDRALIRNQISQIFECHKFVTPFNELGESNGLLIATCGRGFYAKEVYANETAFRECKTKAREVIDSSVSAIGVILDSDAQTLFLTKIQESESLGKTVFLTSSPSNTDSEDLLETINIDSDDSLSNMLANLDKLSTKISDALTTSGNETASESLLKSLDAQRDLIQNANDSLLTLKSDCTTNMKGLQEKVKLLQSQNRDLEIQSTLDISCLQDQLTKQADQLEAFQKQIATAPDIGTVELLSKKMETIEHDRRRILEERSDLEKKLIEHKNLILNMETREARLKNDLQELQKKVNKTSIKATERKHTAKNTKCEPSDLILSDISDDELGVSEHFITSVDKVETQVEVKEESNGLRRAYIYKPSTFGLTVWNPVTTDIGSYMQRVVKACSEAKDLGAKEPQLIRLIMRTLPDEYEFVEAFVETDSKNDHEKFAKEVVRILGAKTQRKMHDFITSQRKAGESILSYFARIVMLYKSSNNITDSAWEKSQAHTSAVYTKIYDACYQNQKAELIRLADHDLEKGTLDISKLKEILINVSKLGNEQINAETIKEVNVVEESKPKAVNKKIICWFCNKSGHVKRQCFKWKKLQVSEGKNREHKDDSDGRPTNDQ